MATIGYLLLGSNLGDRENNLAEARELISRIEGCEIVAGSAIYLSDAVEMAEGTPSFMNQVVKIDYLYTAHELLHSLEKVEQQCGRTDKGKMVPRVIDCDILLFGDQSIATERLTIPHAKLLQRPFAMLPLLEIDPMLVHPTTGKTIASYVTDRQRETVVLYRDHVARSL
ncbi:MAG: 2-amino-4-hydroxy-6-hydroxymethyldihydropteridine diphosphokinase [candidate division Zixibacteria bacterium]|nr:2-amino-4-hydroxy-6-hydroxymethyldihydropteridine diphosphokinase [candidate division Zixibacteria bacterium]